MASDGYERCAERRLYIYNFFLMVNNEKSESNN